MPKSKRDRKIALSKTQKKIGLETKQVSRKYLSSCMPGVKVFEILNDTKGENRKSLCRL